MKLFIWRNIFCDGVFCGWAFAYANNIKEAKSLLLKKAKLEGETTVEKLKQELETVAPEIYGNIPYGDYFYGGAE